jgi:hypothetical protein
MTMILSLSMILTLMLVRFMLCLLLSFLWEAYRDCLSEFQVQGQELCGLVL